MIRKINTRIAVSVAAVATAAVLCAPGVAGAHSADARRNRHARHFKLTDAQKTCLAEQGITFSKDRSRHRAKYRDPAERMKLWAALQTCGVVAKPGPDIPPPGPVVVPATADARPFWWDKADAAHWFAAAKSWRDHDGQDFGRWSNGWGDGDWRDKDWDDHDGARDWDHHDGDRHWGDGDRDGSWGQRSRGGGGGFGR